MCMQDISIARRTYTRVTSTSGVGPSLARIPANPSRLAIIVSHRTDGILIAATGDASTTNYDVASPNEGSGSNEILSYQYYGSYINNSLSISTVTSGNPAKIIEIIALPELDKEVNKL